MVKRMIRSIALVVPVVLAANCNLEVGNPDNAGDGIGRRGELNSISMNLSSYDACTTTADLCTSVPLRFADGSTGYTFEMAQAKLQLSEITLAPYESEAIFTQVDLLNGGEVVLAAHIDLNTVTSAGLTFAGSSAVGLQTYAISGKLLMPNRWGVQTVPLALSYTDFISASSGTNTGEVGISGVTFDATAWFDFSSAAVNVKHLLQHLASPTCADAGSRACAQYSSTLSRLIAGGIARSMKTSNKQQRAAARLK